MYNIYLCCFIVTYIFYIINTAIALLRKYYDKFLENLPADCLVTLEELAKADNALTNETFNYCVSCSSSQKCNKEILCFIIESTGNDNQLLGFSFIIQCLTKESDVAALFRDGEC